MELRYIETLFNSNNNNSTTNASDNQFKFKITTEKKNHVLMIKKGVLSVPDPS